MLLVELHPVFQWQIDGRTRLPARLLDKGGAYRTLVQDDAAAEVQRFGRVPIQGLVIAEAWLQQAKVHSIYPITTCSLG